MSKRDENLLAIRPIIDLELVSDKSPIELFMHQSLRPILKLQHDVLIKVIEVFPHFKPITTVDEALQLEQLKNFIQKNASLKNQILGLAIGCLTTSEFEFYALNRRALDKRIIEMTMTRYLSTLTV